MIDVLKNIVELLSIVSYITFLYPSTVLSMLLVSFIFVMVWGLF